jgi:hypothetical protein
MCTDLSQVVSLISSANSVDGWIENIKTNTQFSSLNVSPSESLREIKILRTVQQAFCDACRSIGHQNRSLLRKGGEILRSWVHFEDLPSSERGQIISAHRLLMKKSERILDEIRGLPLWFSHMYIYEDLLSPSECDYILNWSLRWSSQIKLASSQSFQGLNSLSTQAYEDLVNNAPSSTPIFKKALQNVVDILNGYLSCSAFRHKQTFVSLQLPDSEGK